MTAVEGSYARRLCSLTTGKGVEVVLKGKKKNASLIVCAIFVNVDSKSN